MTEHRSDRMVYDVPAGGEAYISTVEEATTEARESLSRLQAMIDGLEPVIGAQTRALHDAVTTLVSDLQEEAFSRVLHAILGFADAPRYSSVLVLPASWVERVGEEGDGEP